VECTYCYTRYRRVDPIVHTVTVAVTACRQSSFSSSTWTSYKWRLWRLHRHIQADTGKPHDVTTHAKSLQTIHRYNVLYYAYIIWHSAHTHTHTHGARTHARTHTPFNGPLSGTIRSAGNRKVKPIWILLKQETVSGSGISYAICKSAPRSRQMTMPAPHHSVFYRPDALPAAQPTSSKYI